MLSVLGLGGCTVLDCTIEYDSGCGFQMARVECWNPWVQDSIYIVRLCIAKEIQALVNGSVNTDSERAENWPNVRTKKLVSMKADQEG